MKTVIIHPGVDLYQMLDGSPLIELIKQRQRTFTDAKLIILGL